MNRAPSNRKAGCARRLLRYALPYRTALFLAFLLIVAVSASINYLPVLIREITDNCLLDHHAPAGERLHELVRLGRIYLLLALGGHSLRYLQGLLTAWIGQQIVTDLRTAVFRKALRMQQAWYDRTPVGTLITRVTSDVERLQHFVTEGVVGSVADLFMLLGIAGYMLWISPRLAAVLFLLLPPLFALLFFVNHRLRLANRMIRQRQSELNALLQEDLVGMTTIQLFNQEPQAKKEFDGRNGNLLDAHMEEVRWFSSYFPVIETGQSVAVAAILAAGGAWMLAGGGWLTAGTLVAFLACIRQFFQPLGSLSDKAGSFQIALASAERLFDLMDTPEEVQNPPDPLTADALRGPIVFDHVTFAYDGIHPVLRDISFAIEPGRVYAVVGATGSGKSTLVNLLGRFYDPQEGRITIGGNELNRFRKEDLRSRIGFVFQEPFVFAGSVADNISLRQPDLSRDDLIHAARTVHADRFIRDLPAGYDTVLNERGNELSLGQKQLLVMARALAQDPELLFVLDEATANIDTTTEWLIQDALARLMRNRTSIVIAHRLSTIRHADSILVMSHGRLVDQGTHKELMERGGTYRTLYELLL